MPDNILLIAVGGYALFSIVVMVVVLQAALEAKEYFARMNQQHYDDLYGGADEVDD